MLNVKFDRKKSIKMFFQKNMITNFILFMASKFNKIGLFQGLGITVEKKPSRSAQNVCAGNRFRNPETFQIGFRKSEVPEKRLGTLPTKSCGTFHKFLTVYIPFLSKRISKEA